MRLLLDTHLTIWWEASHHRRPAAVIDLVRRKAESVFVSRAPRWEIAIKVSVGRLRIDVAKFPRSIETHGFQWLDIRNGHILGLGSLPTFDDHRDPFDRLLVAQSLTEPLLFLTADAKLGRYGATVRVI